MYSVFFRSTLRRYVALEGAHLLAKVIPHNSQTVCPSQLSYFPKKTTANHLAPQKGAQTQHLSKNRQMDDNLERFKHELNTAVLNPCAANLKPDDLEPPPAT